MTWYTSLYTILLWVTMSENTERPSTPPRRALDQSELQVTPERVRQIEINRLKGQLFLTSLSFSISKQCVCTLAKAAQREREQQSSSSYFVNTTNKRPLIVTPAGQGSPTQPVSSSSKPLKRDSRLGTYFEYDLSKMVNSKGGFLLKEGGEADEDLRRKELERGREKQRKQHNLTIRMCSILQVI